MRRRRRDILAAALIWSLILDGAALAANPGSSSNDAGSAATNLTPPASGDATINEARDRVVRQINYLMQRKDVAFGIYIRTKTAEAMQRHGVPDWQQATLLEGVGWFDGGPKAYGVAPAIASEFYGKNLLPLSKSLSALVAPSAPTHVPRADLDDMDARMRLLLAFEPRVRELIDAALDIEGAIAVVQGNLLAPREAMTKSRFVFDLNLSSPGQQYPLSNQVPSEDNPFYASAYPEDQTKGLQSELKDLLDRRDALLKRFRAMPAQFTVELGKHSDAPQLPKPAADEPFPDDAMPD